MEENKAFGTSEAETLSILALYLLVAILQFFHPSC